jgi:cation diffusion facilitator family transporter
VCRWKDGNPDWLWVDPVCTFIFAFFVILMTKDLLTKSIKDLMEATPANINVDKLCHKLRAIRGVTGVHDLHVWGISSDKILMTAHINVQQESDRAMVTFQADTIAQKAGITHCTVQICVEETVSSP